MGEDKNVTKVSVVSQEGKKIQTVEKTQTEKILILLGYKTK